MFEDNLYFLPAVSVTLINSTTTTTRTIALRISSGVRWARD